MFLDELLLHVVEMVTLVSIHQEIFGVIDRDDLLSIESFRFFGGSLRQNKSFDACARNKVLPVGGS